MKSRRRIKELEYYDNMSAASSAMGFSLATLSKAKAAGCPAFRGPRVHTKELRDWMAEHPEVIDPGEDSTDYKKRREYEVWRKLKRENDLNDGKLVKRQSVCESISRIFSPLMQQVSQKLENEYPSQVAGLDVPGARTYGKRVVDDIRTAFVRFEKEWAI